MNYAQQALPQVPTAAGVSEAARAIDAATSHDIYRTRFSLAGSARWLSELYGLANQYELGSTAVGRVTTAQAVNFVAAMPPELPLPEISIDPDGEVAMDWYRDNDALSVSVNATGRVSFAWNIGADGGHATEYFSGRLTPALLGFIQHFA